jgi:hypothetical protein
MKRKISKDEFAALPEALKQYYKQEGDSYVLQLEGDEDAGALRRAKDREVEARKAAEKKAQELQDQINSLTDGNARKAGDIATLEKSWKEKHEQLKTEFESKLSAKDKYIKDSLLKGTTAQLAAALAGENSILLVPHIKERLTVDFSGEAPVLRVLDKDGNASALSLEDLKKEFVENKQFASIIIGSKATGGAGSGRSGNGGSSGAGDKKFNELTEAERIEWYKRDPEGFKAAAKAASQR